MITCSVKPYRWICRNCLDEQANIGVILDCDTCPRYSKRYEILSMGNGIFGNKATLLDDGTVITISQDRLFNLKRED